MCLVETLHECMTSRSQNHTLVHSCFGKTIHRTFLLFRDVMTGKIRQWLYDVFQHVEVILIYALKANGRVRNPSQPLSLGTPCSLISTTLGPWASQLDSSHPGSGSPLISTHLRISTSLSISASQPDSMSQPISTISTTLISPHTHIIQA